MASIHFSFNLLVSRSWDGSRTSKRCWRDVQ